MHMPIRLTAKGVVVASVLGFFSAANAADVLDHSGGLKDDPAPTMVPIWAGLYVGGNIGYGWGDVRDGFTFLPIAQSKALDGVVFGGHVGYNFQRGDIVFGVEAGMNHTNADADLFSDQVENKLTWYATGVGRVGYAFDGCLLYGFGGVAWGEIKTKIEGVGDDATHVGWTAGAGIERALDDRVSVRLEYAHINFGAETVFEDTIFGDKVRASLDTFKAGVNFKLIGDREAEPLK